MDIEFQKRLLATFVDEAKEHQSAISTGLMALEKDAGPDKRQATLETVFREAHSLKGAARAVGIAGIESLSHAMEGVFAGLKRQDVVPSPPLFDLLHRANDTIGELIPTNGDTPDDGTKKRVRELVVSLELALKVATPPSPPPAPPEAQPLPKTDALVAPSPDRPALSDTIRISSAKLDSLLHQVEEMITAKQSALQRATELGALASGLAAWEKEWKKVRPAVRMLGKQAPARFAPEGAGQLERLLLFCEWSSDIAKALEHKAHTLAKAMAFDRHGLDGMVDNLVDDLKEVLMLPCETLLGALPKMARDLARDRGKEAELTILGDSVEIDKRILEVMKDPLIHLVRNCVDHGIERPEERKRANKPASGKISVKVSLKGSNLIEIAVADDGMGIDPGRVAAAAVRGGIVSQAQADRLEPEELLGMLFKSGFSTSPLITDISGRGLGLAIVREKVEDLGGTVTVASEPRQGTTFRMVIPLTLSTYRGVLVSAGEQQFIVPAAGVERVARVDRGALKTVENRETIELDGQPLSFVRLADILLIPRKDRPGDEKGAIPLFVVKSGAHRIAFGVDGVLDEQEVLVKGLGPQLPRVRNISGATVLGTGKVAAILHPGDLVKSALGSVPAPVGAAYSAEEAGAARRSVLVVEDSITARTLLKNILETAGYGTTTAVDGIDALTQLRTHEIDIVVSDVDMPRMNGFDLTAKIRASREFADLPVVLVTSLDSRDDRERGIEVGANAYIVKSSFDQGNLLDVIKRLI